MFSLAGRVALACACLLSLAALAAGAEFRVGAEFAELSKSNEHDSAFAVVPTVALGARLDGDLLLLAEAGVLRYTVNKSGDRSSSMTSQGTIDISGTSLAAVVAKRVGQAELRMGFGVIQYHYDNKLSADVQAALQSFGFTNAREVLKDATATQIILGVDVALASWLLAGVEFRSVTVNPTVEASASYGGATVIGSGTADLSHTWLAARITAAF